MVVHVSLFPLALSPTLSLSSLTSFAPFCFFVPLHFSFLRSFQPLFSASHHFSWTDSRAAREVKADIKLRPRRMSTIPAGCIHAQSLLGSQHSYLKYVFKDRVTHLWNCRGLRENMKRPINIYVAGFHGLLSQSNLSQLILSHTYSFWVQPLPKNKCKPNLLLNIYCNKYSLSTSHGRRGVKDWTCKSLF